MKDYTYTQAMQRLEAILAQLEEGSSSVDTLSELVKEATTLVNFCKEKLRTTEEEVQKALKDKKISMGHARALIGVDDYAGQVALLNSVLVEGLSVRALEKIIKISKAPKVPKESGKSNLTADYLHVQDQLSRYLGSKIQLKRDTKSGKGTITINFSNESDLNRLIELIEE